MMFLFLLFTVRVIPAGHTELGFRADWGVGLSSDGEAVLCERGSTELRKYDFFNSKYQMKLSKPLPKGVQNFGYKEVSESHIYIQQRSTGNDAVTYKLSSADMTQQGTSQQIGELRGYLPQHGPVYAESVNRGTSVIINVANSGIRLRPPSGKWTSHILSICSAGEQLMVTCKDDTTLDIFNITGEICYDLSM